MDLPVQQFHTKPEQELLDAFTSAEQALPGARDDWVKDLRAKAIATYAALGLPHRRIEAWKYTDLRSRLTDAYPLVRPTGATFNESEIAQAVGARVAQLPVYRLVVADGEFRPDLSNVTALKSAGVEIVSLAEALEHPPAWLKNVIGVVAAPASDPIVALNAALMTGGVIVRVKKGATVDKPLHLIQLDGPGEPAMTVTRNVVVLEEGASASLLESFANSGRSVQRNAVTELLIGDKASLDHVKLQREGAETIHLSTWLVELKEDARYQAFQFSTGAALARNQIYARFAGEGSSVDISGACLARGRQHLDTTLIVEHRVPRCESRELFKLVLDEESRGIFQGKIVVSPGAQKTDGKQMAQALLLSETAEFDSKPELEIYADDVVCGHGATSGQIDEDLLFYLEARGIPEAEARALLIQAFVGEALEKVEDETLRDAFAAASAAWLGVDYD